jgi:hypothetical protein
MQLPLDPDVADTAPTDPALTPYDHEYLIAQEDEPGRSVAIRRLVELGLKAKGE